MPRNSNRSSQAEHFLLCKWLEQKAPTFPPDTSYTTLAAEYSKVSKRSWTAAGIAGGFKTLGIKLPKTIPTGDRKLEILIDAVAVLYAQLGSTASQEFFSILKHLPRKGE